ncbi:alpha/beta hydrolase family protein [Planobispora siamensis]|uniref:Peptidase S9 prolyl oligopeptidase catalytic domain-containing protein n=1 Tax=Planobispora siamensis TaxID=936338 RepID=A0A8J3WII3_9ACTN|nr:prolyl oligopeptidase family serine peptidase [Planobispora siamensis]GIH90603.1 hypothetical protein Psi01_12330 [Planobispora siamensis]
MRRPFQILRAAAVTLCLLTAATPASASAGPSPSPPASTTGAEAALAVPSDLTAKEVDFRGSGGLAMRGTVLSPAEGPAKAPAEGRAKRGPGRPGIVLVHGSGAGVPRAKLREEAVAFARQGLSVLIYDKRSEGYSLFRRSYSQLADDALGAVAALRSQPGVDPAGVGVWGFSEGGWVAPIAASRSAEVAFVVLVGANGMPPLRQQTWAVAAGLRKAGVSGPLVERAEPAMYRLIADGGMFPEPYHDPGPVLAAVRQPVLGIWGVHDLLTPPQENPPLVARALEEGGNRRYAFHFFPDADHAAHRTPDGGVTRLPELAPGYADLVGSWVGDVTAGRAPAARTSGPAPVQDSVSVPAEPPAWWESAPVQLAALVLFTVAFAAYPLVALVRRLRGRSRRPVTRAARLLAATGAATVLGSFIYLFYVLMTGGKLAAPGPVAAGRPLIWLALQALAVTCVAATVLTASAWYRSRGSADPARPGERGERVRLGLLLAGGVAFVPWALYWGLLLP